MTGGFQNLRIYRRARRNGETLERACELSGLTIGEARLTDADDAKFPPPPEAYELLDQKRGAGRDEQPAPITDMKESTMVAAAKNDDDYQGNGEYGAPDADRAIEIFDDHIAPKLTQMNTIKGDLKEPWQMVKDEANVPRKEFNYVQSLVDEDDDAKLEHRLRALRALLSARGLTIQADLVDKAQGHNSADIVPITGRGTPFLPGVTDDDDGEG